MGTMDEQERDALLDRVQRSSRTIGAEIPDELTVQGQTLDLNEFVFECKRLETVSEDRYEQVETLRQELKRERLARKRQLEDGDITAEEGERLVQCIHGIDRAVNALESIDRPAIGEQLRQKKLDDARELRALIDQATL